MNNNKNNSITMQSTSPPFESNKRGLFKHMALTDFTSFYMEAHIFSKVSNAQ